MKRSVLLVLLLIIEIAFTVQFSIKILSILHASHRIDLRKTEHDALLRTLSEREAHLAYVRTDMYVEEIARTKLRYSLDGEQVYVVHTAHTEVPVLPRVDDLFSSEQPWWYGAYQWFILFFGYVAEINHFKLSLLSYQFNS